MTRPFAVVLASSILALAFAACGGEKKLGESCDESGKTEGECETGTVCGKNVSEVLQCLKVCSQQADCPSDQECNGVDGSSVKGCRPKSTSSTSGGTTSGGTTDAGTTSSGGSSSGGKK